MMAFLGGLEAETNKVSLDKCILGVFDIAPRLCMLCGETTCICGGLALKAAESARWTKEMAVTQIVLGRC